MIVYLWIWLAIGLAQAVPIIIESYQAGDEYRVKDLPMIILGIVCWPVTTILYINYKWSRLSELWEKFMNKRIF